MKFFKNKFFIILLAIAVFASIFTATLSVMGVTDPIKNVANVISVPFRYIGAAVKESFEGFSEYFTAIEKLDEENKRLEGEIDRLESELADLRAGNANPGIALQCSVLIWLSLRHAKKAPDWVPFAWRRERDSNPR